MKLLYKVAILFALAASFLVFAPDFVETPFVYARLFTMFLMGAVMTLFVEGPRYGTLAPISTRAVWVLLGVVIMGASMLWMLVLRGH
jgi:hypothetical protein